MTKLQRLKPKRTFLQEHANYREYKSPLRSDFNKRCGYCDDDDFFMGGQRGFHIDHFKPKKHFTELTSKYSNLVYACPFCNGAKSNKWKDTEGFVDPCSLTYEEHLHRNSKGKINPKTDQGQYIHENLNLGLIRHEIIWLIGKLEEQKEELKKLKKQKIKADSLMVKLLENFMEIQEKIDDYYVLYKEGL